VDCNSKLQTSTALSPFLLEATVARNRQVYMEMVVEALLTIFLPKKRTDTYRH